MRTHAHGGETNLHATMMPPARAWPLRPPLPLPTQISRLGILEGARSASGKYLGQCKGREGGCLG